jgi:hypothetical protein
MGGYLAGLLAFGLFDRTPRARSPDAVVDN